MDDRVRDAPHTTAAAGRVAWWRSLRFRLLFWSTFTSLMLMAALAAGFYLGVRQLMLDNARAQLRELAHQAALALGATMDSVEVDAEGLRLTILQPDSPPERWRAVMESTVLADPYIVGAMVIVEPGRLAGAADGWTWYVRADGDTLVGQTVEELGYVYARMPWYQRTVGGDTTFWSDPYANAATGNRLFVTYNLPLRRPRAGGGHEVIGMVSLDVPLTRLRDMLAGNASTDDAKPGLLSPGGLFAAHIDPEVATHRSLTGLVDAGRTDLQLFVDAVRERREFAAEHVAAVDGDGFAERVQAGEARYSIVVPVADTGWTVTVGAANHELLAGLGRITWAVLIFGVIGGLTGMWAMKRTTAMVADPIEDLTDSAQHFGDGEFDRPIGHVERDDEVGVMARVFDATRHSIKRQMAEIAELGAARARLDGELRIAGDIQQAMLPPDRSFTAGGATARFAGRLEPAKAVGGDFFDFFSLDGENVWFMIGDVSDKGVPAALFMARTMTALEAAARLGNRPGEALRGVAQYLEASNEACMFATVLCGTLHLRSGAVMIASAAHEAPILLHADGTRELLEIATEGPLGVDVADDYVCWRGTFRPGDTLLGYTDGVTEAFDTGDVAFGIDRLLPVPVAGATPAAHCQRIIAAVHAFAAGAPQSDDITVLAVRYERDGAAAGTDGDGP